MKLFGLIRKYSVFFVFLGLLQSGVLIAEPQQITGLSEQPTRIILAKVNGEPIYKDQVAKRLQAKRSKTAKAALTDSDLMLSERDRWERALDQEIEIELYYQGGKKLNPPNAEEVISKSVHEFKATLTKDQLRLFTDDIIREEVQRRFYINEYMVANDLVNPQVPETEVKAYYEKTKQGFARKKPAVKVSHILVKVGKDSSEEDRKQAYEKIEKARADLLKGKSFDDVAKEYSDDINNASIGGDLGSIERGFMPPEFEEVAFSIEPEVISKIIKTKHGYHVLKVLKKKPKGYIPAYEEMRDFFAKYLAMRYLPRKRSAHIQELREKADVEIFLFKSADKKLIKKDVNS